jgi:hypothetical protein
MWTNAPVKVWICWYDYNNDKLIWLFHCIELLSPLSNVLSVGEKEDNSQSREGWHGKALVCFHLTMAGKSVEALNETCIWRFDQKVTVGVWVRWGTLWRCFILLVMFETASVPPDQPPQETDRFLRQFSFVLFIQDPDLSVHEQQTIGWYYNLLLQLVFHSKMHFIMPCFAESCPRRSQSFTAFAIPFHPRTHHFRFVSIPIRPDHKSWFLQ